MSTSDVERRGAAGALAGDLRSWLASGALQSDGAFCAWRDAANGELAFAYPEITGYALTWLAGRSEPTAQELDAGRSAAAWLDSRLGAGDRSARNGWDDGAVYCFDLGMIAAGLISFGVRAGDAATEQLGRGVARDLAAFVEAGGHLPAVAPDGPATTRPSSWSTDGVAHMTKCVQALLLADEHDAARTLIAAGAAEEVESGRFRTQPDDTYVMLHPHLYTVEGLWMYAEATGDDDAAALARRAAEWAWRWQLSSGGLPRFADLAGTGDEGPEQWDVTAQAIRAALMTGAQPEGLDLAIGRLAELARPATGGQALVYQPEAGAEHHNAWVSMFGAQALELAAGGRSAMSWQQLV